jgi:hypothetical protein
LGVVVIDVRNSIFFFGVHCQFYRETGEKCANDAMPPCGVFIGVCLSYPFVSPEKTAYGKAPIRRPGLV